MTKLRISNHQLRIETGPPIDQYNCLSCKNKIEDELHFLFDCDYYHGLQEYNNMISYFQFLNCDFDSLPNDEKWIFVLTINDHYTNYVLCSFVAIIRKRINNKVIIIYYYYYICSYVAKSFIIN